MFLLLFVVHLFATAAMTGIIWFVQISHYPLFQFIQIPESRRFHQAHQTRTGWVVAPLMLTELFTGALLLNYLSDFYSSAVFLCTLLALLLIWLSTFSIQIPLHRKLEREHQAKDIQHLVRTNWLRTFLWSLRSIGLLGLLLCYAMDRA